MEAKKSAAIKAHQRFGASRVGTLRDHESVAAAHTLDVNFSTHVARNRKFLDMSERSGVNRSPLIPQMLMRNQVLTGNSGG
jgi:hypothetical protein